MVRISAPTIEEARVEEAVPIRKALKSVAKEAEDSRTSEMYGKMKETMRKLISEQIAMMRVS